MVEEQRPFFGYGSLLWNPGFKPARSRYGRLAGYSRSFCMRSVHHRGKPDEPGLVLALDRRNGSFCRGLILWAEPTEFEHVLKYVRNRELVTSAYRETDVEVELDDGTLTPAIAYVVDRSHHQYCGDLPAAEQARIIARSSGISGLNRDYLSKTVECLSELGIDDPNLAGIERLVAAIS